MSTFDERMRLELEVLVDKVAKADVYLETHEDDLLTAQVHAMMTYASVLECRLDRIARVANTG